MNALRRITNALGMARVLPKEKLESAETWLKVVNLSRGTVLATHLEVAVCGKQRRRGLLGRDSLPPGGGLWIIPCESVHTFFMRFPIDLIYLDRKNGIRKVRSDVGAWRLSACLSAHSVLELPAGTIRRTDTQQGDTVEFTPLRPKFQRGS